MRTQIKTTTKSKKEARVNIPLSALRCLSGYPKEKKVVCEINVSKLKKANDPSTIDEMVTEARLEYCTGKLKGFKNTKKLLADLGV